MTECFFFASRGSSLTHGWPGSQSGADMRPGRRSVTASFLPGTHFSPLGGGQRARVRRLPVVNGIHAPRGRLAAVGAALAAASLTIRPDCNSLSPKTCERSEQTPERRCNSIKAGHRLAQRESKVSRRGLADGLLGRFWDDTFHKAPFDSAQLLRKKVISLATTSAPFISFIYISRSLFQTSPH